MLQFVRRVDMAKDLLFLERPIVIDRQELLPDRTSPLAPGSVDNLARGETEHATVDLRGMSCLPAALVVRKSCIGVHGSRLKQVFVENDFPDHEIEAAEESPDVNLCRECDERQVVLGLNLDINRIADLKH